MKSAALIANPYLIVCVLALAAQLVVQLRQGMDLISLLMLVTGALGAIGRLRVTPTLYLLLVAADQLVRQITWGAWVGRGIDALELLRCAAAVAFVMGHFRLQGTIRPLVPIDSRLPAAPPRVPRGEELSAFLTLVLFAALGAYLLWLRVARPLTVLNFDDARVARVLLVAWLLAIGFVVAGGFFSYWRRRNMTAAEAHLSLQDVVWQQTRGDQRHIQRVAARERIKRKGQS